MKKERIEELYDIHTSEPNAMNLNDFAYAINQAEYEWYKKLDNRIGKILNGEGVYNYVIEYQKEIQNKIKELEK